MAPSALSYSWLQASPRSTRTLTWSAGATAAPCAPSAGLSGSPEDAKACRVRRRNRLILKLQCNSTMELGSPWSGDGQQKREVEHAANATDSQEKQECEDVKTHQGGMLPVANFSGA